MAITIPAVASKTFEEVMDSLGGEDYSYYVFDLMKVNDGDKAKLKVALKVYVPQSERVRAVGKIQASLNNKNIATISKKAAQLDVYLPNSTTGEYIRLDIKPSGSKGSGGGAAATAIQESAQCVYAAMRYYCGDVKYFTEDDFNCGMAHVDVGGTTLEDIMSLPSEWQEGSWAGANEIFDTVGGTGYKFVRGDSLLDDGSIKKAFGRVKGQTNLSSEDKWNPADIWMVKQSEISAIKKKLDAESTIDGLNELLLQLFADQTLMGISLKKIEGGKANMTIKNNIPAAQRKANEKANYQKFDLTFDNGRKKDNYPMDVYFYYGPGQFEKFQARNFGGENKGDWKLELKGKNAAQGKIQGKVVRDLLKNAGFNISALTEPAWSDCKPGTGGKKDSITTEIYNLLKKYNATGFSAAKKDEINTMGIISQQPQSWRYSKLAGLRMLDWLENETNANEAMKEIYLYASSQSDKSSVYYKLQ